MRMSARPWSVDEKYDEVRYGAIGGRCVNQAIRRRAGI
jgi:hypothetical protein